MFLVFAVSSIFAVQISSAQIISLGMPNGQISNIQRTVNIPNNVVVANNGFQIANNGIQIANNGFSNTVPLNSLSNVQVARNLVGNANNVINTGNLVSLGGNFGKNVALANIGSNSGSNFVGRNIGAVMNANVPVNLANGFNINTGTFAVQDNGLAALLPVNFPIGIQIVGEALEVSGSVGVTGKMPFYTTIAVNGIVPSYGNGIVNYSCDGQ